MSQRITARLTDAELRALDQIPGVSRTEKLRNAVMHQAITAAIAKAVADEIRQAQEPTRELLQAVKQLRADVATLSGQSRATEQKAAAATQAVAAMLPAVEERMREREKQLEQKIAGAMQALAQKEERTQKWVQALIDRLGGNR